MSTFICKKIAICGLICRAKIFKRQYLRSYGLWDLILQFYCFCPNMTIAIFFSTWIQRKRKIFIFHIWHRIRYFDFFGKQSILKFEEKNSALIWWLYFFLFHNCRRGSEVPGPQWGPGGALGPGSPGTFLGPQRGPSWKTQKDYQDRSVPSRARLGPL